MKISGEKLVSNQPGTIKIIPEKPDDIWLLFNLIANDDHVTTFPTRVQVNIEIKVTAIDYDKECSMIRVSGKTIMSGIFHTLELETMKEFNLRKKRWDEETIRVLMESSQNCSIYDLAVILIKDKSTEILLIDKKTITRRATIRCQESREKFFDNLFVSFMKHIDMNVIPDVVIASNGSVKNDFRAYLLVEAKRWFIKSIWRNKSGILMVNKNKLKDVLSDKMVINVMKNKTKSEIKKKELENFMRMMIIKCDRVCYGSNSVEYAHELLAIDTLLVTDEILINKDIKLRKKYSTLKKSVQKAGGKVLQFNDTEGESLAQMTGIAAILRFPIPNLDDLVL